MLSLRSILRRLLADRGYLLRRVEPEIPPSVPEYLRFVLARAAEPASVICFDNETSIQSEILEVFPADRVFFSCPLFIFNGSTPAPGSVPPPTPTGRFVVVLDVETFPVNVLLEHFPWLRLAEVLLVRSRFGAFWTGELDLCRLGSQLESLGFYLADFLDLPQLSHPQAPAARALLAYERVDNAALHSTGARYRALEALAYLSTPIVHRRDFRLLAGRGSFGFAAGILNPGAIVDGDRTYLLPRADRVPWALQKADESHFFSSSQPLLFTLGADHHIANVAELSTVGLPEAATRLTGDFRLFRFRNEIFSNHFVMSSPRRHVVPGRPLQIEELQTRVGISRLDLEKQQLIWCGFPTIHRPLARDEKNWAAFAAGARLLMLYSFSPYVLLASTNWPGLEFTTVLETRLTLPFDGDGLPIRNSINPVEYDDGHWLHIVHKVYPGKQYAFWAVLIDKQTLVPVQASARPLVRGWHSFSASIIYACSVIAGPTDITIFAGMDDSATAVASIPRERLDAEWFALPRTTPAPPDVH